MMTNLIEKRSVTTLVDLLIDVGFFVMSFALISGALF